MRQGEAASTPSLDGRCGKSEAPSHAPDKSYVNPLPWTVDTDAQPFAEYDALPALKQSARVTGRRVPLYERSGEGERASASGLVALAQSGGEDAGPARPDGDES